MGRSGWCIIEPPPIALARFSFSFGAAWRVRHGQQVADRRWKWGETGRRRRHKWAGCCGRNSVAIVGASPDRGSIGANALENLLLAGYQGDIYLVSRSRKEINGRPCVPSIDDLPLGIDAVVLVVPEAVVVDFVAACARRQGGKRRGLRFGFRRDRR